MPHGLYAQCPNCGRIATGESEIEAIFGYRFGHTKPQSWCKSCRNGKGYSVETLSVWDACDIWLSHGMDEDYMFGYTEQELRDAME